MLPLICSSSREDNDPSRRSVDGVAKVAGEVGAAVVVGGRAAVVAAGNAVDVADRRRRRPQEGPGPELLQGVAVEHTGTHCQLVTDDIGGQQLGCLGVEIDVFDGIVVVGDLDALGDGLYRGPRRWRVVDCNRREAGLGEGADADDRPPAPVGRQHGILASAEGEGCVDRGLVEVDDADAALS